METSTDMKDRTIQKLWDKQADVDKISNAMLQKIFFEALN